jgi:hypothetical protein
MSRWVSDSRQVSALRGSTPSLGTAFKTSPGHSSDTAISPTGAPRSQSVRLDAITDDTARGAKLGEEITRSGMFDDGLPAAVDALARAAFTAGLAAARLHPPLQDPEAFYCGLIQGIQEADLALRYGKCKRGDPLVPKASDTTIMTALAPRASPADEQAGPGLVANALKGHALYAAAFSSRRDVRAAAGLRRTGSA